jgi:Chaperone of endosialidase
MERKYCVCISTIILILSVSQQSIAQNIEAKLAGDSDKEGFVVENKSGGAVLHVTGDSSVGVGPFHNSHTALSVTARGAKRNAIFATSESSGSATLDVANFATKEELATHAIRGQVEAPGAAAIIGWSYADTKDGNGIVGVTNAPSGLGLYGIAQSLKGTSTGVAGLTSAEDGAGLSGMATARIGTASGMRASTEAEDGAGVEARALSLTGNTRGIHGEVNSPDGVAVLGISVSQNGGIGIVGVANSLDGYAGYFSGRGHFAGDVGIATDQPKYTLHVNGDAGKPGGGSWTNASDIRLKNIRGEYSKGLSEVMQLHPIKFNYKPGNARGYSPESDEIGLVAQEVQKVFPEAVTTGEDGYMDLNVHSINIAMINAMKDLYKTVETQQEMIDELKRKLADVEQNSAPALQHTTHTD